MFNLKAIKDSADIVLKRKEKTGSKTVLACNYANETSFNIKSDAIYATKKGVRAIKFNKAKEGTLKMGMEVMDLKWLPILLGGDFKSVVGNILNIDKLTVESGKITLSDTPKTGTLEVFVLENDDVSHKKEVKAGVTTNPDEYAITGKDITFNATTQPNETRIVCYYVPTTAVTGQSYKVLSQGNTSNYEIYGSTMTKDDQGIEEFFKFYVPNASPISEFNLALDVNNVAKLDVTFDLLDGVFPDTKERGLVEFNSID